MRRLQATTDIARALEGDMELPRMLDLIAKRGRATVDATYLMVVLADERDLVVEAIAGSLDRGRIGTRLAREGTVIEDVIQSGSRRVADLSETLADALGDGSIAAAEALFVPLLFQGTAYGVLVAADDCGPGRHLSTDDVRVLEAFAAAGAHAIHTARSVATDRLRHSIEASERERRRWARELHDETLQGLGGLKVLLSSALRRSDGGLADAVRKAVAQLTDEIGSLRALITELRPAALDELGLVPAIETLAQRTATPRG